MTTEKMYATIFMFWETKNVECSMLMHDKTEAEAIAIAEASGYLRPRWYTFWRSKIYMSKIL